MTSNRRLARWGALALLVAAMSGCCVAPWGGRYYGGGGYHDGGHWQGGGDRGPGGPGPGGPGGGWHH